MRAKDLKIVVDHIVETLGENAEVVIGKGEDLHEPEFWKRFKNDGDIVKPRIIEDGCIIVPGVKVRA